MTKFERSMEERENRDFDQALILLGVIIENLNPEDFTFEEIQEEFGRSTPSTIGRERKFTRGHLELLVKHELVAHAEEEGHYRVTDEGRMYYETHPLEAQAA